MTGCRRRGGGAYIPSSRLPVIPSVRKILGHLLHPARVEDLLGPEARLPRHPGAGHQRAVLADGVRVGIDGEADAERQRARDVAPIEVEAVRIAVDLHDHAARGATLEDPVEVDAVAVAREQLAAGDVAEEGDV